MVKCIARETRGSTAWSLFPEEFNVFGVAAVLRRTS